MNDTDQASASFEQAKNPAQGPQSLPIVAKPELMIAGAKAPARLMAPEAAP